MMPATIAIGVLFLGDRQYYFISLMIIVYAMIPFFMVFEKRKPQAREMIVITVLAAIAVAGRAAFFMLPQFKPVTAIVIIAAVCFGGEAGFLVGVLAGFVSNFFFMQGPWTPWQMFSFGIIGLIAGVVFKKGRVKPTRIPLCIFGGLAALFAYGGIMSIQGAASTFTELSLEEFLSMFAIGFWFNMIHAIATSLFLLLISQPFIEKLERIKLKYGMIERLPPRKIIPDVSASTTVTS